MNDGEEDHGEEVLHAEDGDSDRGLQHGVWPALYTQVIAFQQLQQILNTGRLEDGVRPALYTQVVAFQQLQQILNTDKLQDGVGPAI